MESSLHTCKPWCAKQGKIYGCHKGCQTALQLSCGCFAGFPEQVFGTGPVQHHVYPASELCHSEREGQEQHL